MKVCPLMSRPANYPDSDFGMCDCIKELCMAWEPETEAEVIGCGVTPKGYECRMTLAEKYPHILDFDSNGHWLWCDTCIESKCEMGKKAFCKLIERD